VSRRCFPRTLPEREKYRLQNPARIWPWSLYSTGFPGFSGLRSARRIFHREKYLIFFKKVLA